MTKRISKAIDILLDAVNTGTLAKGNCGRCAVGNLVAYGLGGYVDPNMTRSECLKGYSSDWADLFVTRLNEQFYYRNSEKNYNVLLNIKATDFNLEELMKIEYTFETNTEIDFSDYNYHTKEEILKDQVEGLEAVVQVMMDFDDVKESVQEVFTSKVLSV